MLDETRKYTIVIMIAWLAAGMASLAWNLYDDRSERHHLAVQSARSLIANIRYTRTWNARHGGVYVPITPADQPNPFLNDLNRDLETIEGLLLTKINPAYMTRQISEIATEYDKAQFHITSLNPIRPENRPHEWERPWLEGFNNGEVEASEFIHNGDQYLFHYMAPLIVRESCLECHARQGYKVGDVRGGISISYPMDKTRLNWTMIASHLLAMAAGSIMLIFFGARLNNKKKQVIETNLSLQREIGERKQAEEKLRSAHDLLEKRVEQRTVELSKANEELSKKIRQKESLQKALTIIYHEFYQLFNSAPDGMLVIDKESLIIRVNQAFTRLCGIDENRIIGQKCSSIIGEDHCSGTVFPLKSLFNGKERFEKEFEIPLKNGTTIPCIVTATPFLEPDGAEIGAVMVIKDITSRKAVELTMAEKTEQLKRSNKALQDFAHVISHDLQEPLMLIQAFSRRLQKQIGDSLDEQCQTYVGYIDGSATRMKELITGVLHYARAGNKPATLVQVDLNEIIDQVCDDLTLRIERNNARIHVAALPVIEADSLQMRQVFQNIIGNSLKYRHEHRSPEISIYCDAVLRADKSDEAIRITVKDNGIGFAPEMREKIFDIYERLDTDIKHKGSGIGLAICRKIVEQYKGTVTAESRPGEGTYFIVILPVCQDDPKEEPVA